MKGLYQIPTEKDLLRAYNGLQNSLVKKEMCTEAKLVLWSQWSRFDPRLGEILVTAFVKQWRSLNPLILNDEILAQPWGAALGVILQNALLLIKKSEQIVFRNWTALVMSLVRKAPCEQFYIGVNKIGGKKMFQEASASLISFSRWGYLSSELMINKAARFTRMTTMPKEARLLILNNLIASSNVITVADYLARLPGVISARQAERDLKEHNLLVGRGHTRRRHYLLTPTVRTSEKK